MTLPIVPPQQGGFSEAMQGFQAGEDVTTQIQKDVTTMTDSSSSLQDCISAYQDVQSLLSTDEAQYSTIDPDFSTLATTIQGDLDTLAKTISPQVTDPYTGNNVTLSYSVNGGTPVPATLYDVIQSLNSSDQNFTVTVNVNNGCNVNWVDQQQVTTEINDGNGNQWFTDQTHSGLSWELTQDYAPNPIYLHAKGTGAWVQSCATSSGETDGGKALNNLLNDLNNA